MIRTVTVSGLFQSTPAHQDGRNGRRPDRPDVQPCFNPLPPTRTGETHVAMNTGATRRCFNPLPPTRTGETLRARASLNSSLFQSTPAHQDGRNLAPSFNPVTLPFQSTPAHQDGRNLHGDPVLLQSSVSIHSRPPGREKHLVNLVHDFRADVSIHSRPPGREKRGCAGPGAV